MHVRQLAAEKGADSASPGNAAESRRVFFALRNHCRAGGVLLAGQTTDVDRRQPTANRQRRPSGGAGVERDGSGYSYGLISQAVRRHLCGGDLQPPTNHPAPGEQRTTFARIKVQVSVRALIRGQ